MSLGFMQLLSSCPRDVLENAGRRRENTFPPCRRDDLRQAAMGETNTFLRSLPGGAGLGGIEHLNVIFPGR